MATVSVNSGKPQVATNEQLKGKGQNNGLALFSLMALFFMMGFITCLNDILIPYMKRIFDLNYFQAMAVQMCFFGAYFVMSIPSSIIVKRLGYKGGMILGFFVAAVGAALFYPAAEIEVYGLFLAALFILATGIVLLQVAGNPFVAVLGSPETASARLTMTQAFNSVATFLAPVFGVYFILDHLPEDPSAAIESSAVQLPYLGIAAVLLFIGLILMAVKLPKINEEEKGHSLMDGLKNAFAFKQLRLGVFGLFAYVGAEVALGSFLVNYLVSDPELGFVGEADAGVYLKYYWGGAMVGRILGTLILRFLKPSKILMFNAFISVALVVTTMLTVGQVSMWAFIGVGLFNSIMFPTIFTLAIAGLGKYTDDGSGLLCTAIVGGAVVPAIQGALADFFQAQDGFAMSESLALKVALILPIICYLYILWYGFKGHKPKIA